MEETYRQNAIDEVLRCILAFEIDEAGTAAQRLPESETRELLIQLCQIHAEMAGYANEIAKGNFSTIPPAKGNILFGSLKNLHSKLIHITWQIGQVARGDYTQVVDYLGELSDGFNTMTQLLGQRQQQIEYLTKHDADTGLLNRSFFMREVFDLITAEPNEAGVLLYIGMDNLKYINDTYSREVGDRYILRASNIFRIFETGGGLAGRMSGDEFALYLHGFDSPGAAFDEGLSFARERLSKYLFTVQDVSYKFRASIGVAIYPEDTCFVDELIKYAAYTMYDLKRCNKGSVARFDSTVYSKGKETFNKQIAFDALLDERQIHFAFQPIIDMKDGSIFGYEALMRPKMPEFSSPLDILDVAESQAKMFPLEKLTFEVLFEWVGAHYPNLRGKKIFFNIISDRFLAENEIKRMHPHYDDILPHLIFEILESSTEDGNLTENISAFRDRFNATVALDDYGVGHSNHYRLLNLNADIVKIDRFLIADIHLNPDKRTMLEDIVAFCYSKDIKLLVEGVEKPEELRVCMQMGVDYAQGFYFARPSFDLPDPSVDYKSKLDKAAK